MKIGNNIKFLIQNVLKGFAWFAVLLLIYLLLEEIVIFKNSDAWIERFYAKPLLVYAIYFASEFFIGIFPPELFMIWAFNKGDTLHYVFTVSFLAVVSYFIGYLTFLIGRLLHKKEIFKNLQKKFFTEQISQLKKYGLFLIIVAAITPVPWSAVCLLVGSSGYPSDKFMKYAISRILRFAVYGFIVFKTLT
ncbi:MAG: hypothetical protein LBV47_01515 [Bacteroidales bacterium]|jgi:membrane protein YqaA with SNARE-associated domain|nr:hypothetical protein [Bacteroidales bacterium]